MSLKQTIILITLGTISLLYGTSPGRYAYILKIQAPSTLRKHEPWLVVYKGAMLYFQSNTSTAISEQTLTFTFSILVTSEMPQPMRYKSTGAIPCLTRIRGAPIRWFDLTLQSPTHPHESWSWDIRELTITEMPKRIPDHAIIFIYDPELIESIDQPVKTKYAIDTTHQGGHCTFELPTIRLKNRPAEILQRACEQACLSSPDLRTCHERCVPRGRAGDDRCLFLDVYAS